MRLKHFMIHLGHYTVFFVYVFVDMYYCCFMLFFGHLAMFEALREFMVAYNIIYLRNESILRQMKKEHIIIHDTSTPPYVMITLVDYAR